MSSVMLRSLALAIYLLNDSSCVFSNVFISFFFFFQAEDGIRDDLVTGVQTCALPISQHPRSDLFPTRRRTSRRNLDRRGRDQEQRLQMAWTQLSAWLFWIRFYRRIAPPDGVAATQRMRPSTTSRTTPANFETLVSSVTCERRFLLFIFLFVNQGAQFRIG